MGSLLQLLAIFTNLYFSTSAYSFPFSLKPIQTTNPINNPNQAFKLPQHNHLSNHAHNQIPFTSKFSWKNFLVSLLGGFPSYNLVSNPPHVFANEKPKIPLEPDISSCDNAREPHPSNSTWCPPPEASKEIIDFKIPQNPIPIYIRKPTYMLTQEQIAKLERAFELMKALPDEDPRSFKNQANIHSAYCDGLFSQVGFPDQMVKIHHSSLFFFFHRTYMYFFERILRELVNDPTLTLPFWHWDHSIGMAIPSIYQNPNSSLYNGHRDPRHLPSFFVSLDYDLFDPNKNAPTITSDRQRDINYAILYNNVVRPKTTSLFQGVSYFGGEKPNPGGTMFESEPHNTVHSWTGNHSGEDMGIYYSAGRDPIFTAHHGNIDRMWTIWKTLPGRKDFSDPAWLDSSLLFYNEKKELVRIKIRDCLDTENLGYRYEALPIPWLEKPLKAHKSRGKSRGFKTGMRIRKFGTGVKMAKDVFPARLDKAMNVLVARPKKRKGEEFEEVLEIGVEVNMDVFVKFDVLINYEEGESGHKYEADEMEFAGSFVSLAHKGKNMDKLKTRQRVGISEMLEDLGAQDENYVQITLVPRSENGDVYIGGVEIVLDGLSS